jgi:hypothetical protein
VGRVIGNIYFPDMIAQAIGLLCLEAKGLGLKSPELARHLVFRGEIFTFGCYVICIVLGCVCDFQRTMGTQ